jgi:hypothetical protein
MRRVLSLAVLFVLSTPAYSWNNTGHMVAARLAWQKLNQAQKDKAVQILKKHPHYQEFLSADRPDGFTEPEWVFLRAATWPDWVKTHHKGEGFDHRTWHYINYPFILPGSGIDPASHQPPADQENIVQQLGVVVKQIKSGGSQVDQAVALCWLLHLGGDVHQPLHTAALFSKQFPDGDRGGNLAYIVLHSGANKTELHSMWDGLLGKSTSAAAIGQVVQEVNTLIQANPELIKDDLEKHTTFESWAKESFEVAKKQAYLNGTLPLGDGDEEASDIDVAPEDYTKNSGRTARIQIAKAGARLATTLATVLE